MDTLTDPICCPPDMLPAVDIPIENDYHLLNYLHDKPDVINDKSDVETPICREASLSHRASGRRNAAPPRRHSSGFPVKAAFR
ncbi:hypothetical protein [Paenibacillus beijingensis]|uniref:Uncharacterized protein n=1 Tax=Paenibacillus beijingensis TaxID=1126833 RepID=A0A0D5NHA7_9BACL|nr:hypothetical protein [Paenibacillus beijingensis]AJY74636.1 hypothetical protein VN24_08665 [Paenibacillus beijingensis]